MPTSGREFGGEGGRRGGQLIHDPGAKRRGDRGIRERSCRLVQTRDRAVVRAAPGATGQVERGGRREPAAPLVESAGQARANFVTTHEYFPSGSIHRRPVGGQHQRWR